MDKKESTNYKLPTKNYFNIKTHIKSKRMGKDIPYNIETH